MPLGVQFSRKTRGAGEVHPSTRTRRNNKSRAAETPALGEPEPPAPAGGRGKGPFPSLCPPSLPPCSSSSCSALPPRRVAAGRPAGPEPRPGRGSHHPGAEADDGGVPRAGVDVAPVEAVLHVGVGRLGVEAPLVGGGLSQEADGEERSDEGRAGRQVEEELLPEGGESVVSLGGGGGGGRPGVGGSAGAPPPPPEVDIGGEGLAELIHPGRSHDLVLAELLQQLGCKGREAHAPERGGRAQHPPRSPLHPFPSTPLPCLGCSFCLLAPILKPSMKSVVSASASGASCMVLRAVLRGEQPSPAFLELFFSSFFFLFPPLFFFLSPPFSPPPRPPERCRGEGAGAGRC